MEHFCPIYSMAPAVAIVWVVAGIVLKKENGLTPMERVRSFVNRAEPRRN
jgi:hypothetical protein